VLRAKNAGARDVRDGLRGGAVEEKEGQPEIHGRFMAELWDNCGISWGINYRIMIWICLLYNIGHLGWTSINLKGCILMNQQVDFFVKQRGGKMSSWKVTHHIDAHLSLFSAANNDIPTNVWLVTKMGRNMGISSYIYMNARMNIQL